MNISEKTIKMVYVNYRGEVSVRIVTPQTYFFGTYLPFHPESQWLMHGYDHKKNQLRTFALGKISSWVAYVPPIDNPLQEV